jgi:thiol-disulfide isomerase/thioredoxin
MDVPTILAGDQMIHALKFKMAATILFMFPMATAMAEPTLTMGDPAPRLTVSNWVKGPQIGKFMPGQIYIVEFWATWCGPCLQAIPHLNELKKQYGDKITVIGVASSERGDSTAEKLQGVAEFVERGNPPMEYSVAFDDSPSMNTDWLEASEARGIPTTYVIDARGRVAFIGHPMELDEEIYGKPLTHILAGDWLGSEAQLKYASDKSKEAEVANAHIRLIRNIIDATKQQDWHGVLAAAEEGRNLPEPYGKMFEAHRAEMWIGHFDRVEDGFHLLETLVEPNWGSVQHLGGLLKNLTHPKVPASLRNVELTEKIAARVIDLVENDPDPNIRAKYQGYRWLLLPVVAEYYYQEGQYAEALQLQMLAHNSLGNSENKHRAEIEARLRVYADATIKARPSSIDAAAAASSAHPICVGEVCGIPDGNKPESGCERALVEKSDSHKK